MIDLDATLEEMLADIDWKPQRHHLNLSDLTDERVYESPQCLLSFEWRQTESELSFEWRPTESEIIVELFRLYLKKFPTASYKSLHSDLVCPVKHGIGNAVKRGNDNDPTKSVLLEHYFTKYGVVVAITDKGKGFDYRQIYFLYEQGVRYWTYKGAGLKSFATCGATISYGNGGRTLLAQYLVVPASPDQSRSLSDLVAHRLTQLELVDGLYEIKKRSPHVYYLAKRKPTFLPAFWTRPAFIETYIHSALPEDQRHEGHAALANSAELYDVNKRVVTIRYALGGERIVATFFRRNEQGMRTHEILRAAWNGGFGPDQSYQVPRPLVYHPDRRLLLTTSIDGISLDHFFADSIDELIRACQRAAHWLVKFHATPLDDAAELDGSGQARGYDAAPNGGRRTSDRAEACSGLLRDLWADHEGRAKAEYNPTPAIVPIHGRFGPESILLKDGITAAINFDDSRFGDPASDPSRFSYQLWSLIFKHTGQWYRAKIATNAFLTEYRAANPKHLANLPYLWGKRVLKSLEFHTRHPRNCGSNNMPDRVVEFHVAQFEFAHRYIGTRHKHRPGESR